MAQKRMPATILATCVVPWDEDNRFAEDDFRAHVRMIAERVTPDIYIFGTAGEGHTVTDRQFREIATAFMDEARTRGVNPMLGIIATSLGTVVERIEFGLEAGYRRFQVSFPSWAALSDAEVDTFFRETCGRFGAAEFLHYNTPRGARVLSGAEYGELALRFPNLVALKFTSNDAAVVRELVTRSGPVQCFLTESAFVLARHYARVGLLVSLSGVRLDLPRRFFEATADELPGLGELASSIFDTLLEAVRAETPGVHIDGAYEKLIARAHGAQVPLRLLPPFEGATEASCRLFLDGLHTLPGLESDGGPET